MPDDTSLFDGRSLPRVPRALAATLFTLAIAATVAIVIDTVADPQLKTVVFYSKLVGLTMGWLLVTLGIFFVASEDQSADVPREDRTHLYTTVFIGFGSSLLLISSRFVVRRFPDWILYEVLGYFGMGVVGIGLFVYLLGSRPAIETPLDPDPDGSGGPADEDAD